MQEEDGIVNITELPIRKWTQDYKEFLESLIKPEDKGQKALLVDYKEFHTGANVHFELHPLEGAVPEADTTQLLAKFKLTSKMSLSKSRLMHFSEQCDTRLSSQNNHCMPCETSK